MIRPRLDQPESILAFGRERQVGLSRSRHEPRGEMVSPKVPVIDDDESIVDLLSAYLTREGFQVDVARAGVAGLAKAR